MIYSIKCVERKPFCLSENKHKKKEKETEDKKSLSDEYLKDTNKAIKLKPLNSHLMNE